MPFSNTRHIGIQLIPIQMAKGKIGILEAAVTSLAFFKLWAYSKLFQVRTMKRANPKRAATKLKIPRIVLGKAIDELQPDMAVIDLGKGQSAGNGDNLQEIDRLGTG